MILAVVFAALVLLFAPIEPPPVDPMAERCGYSDPTVEVDIYETCLELFGFTAT
jgi:hypothetical protein